MTTERDLIKALSYNPLPECGRELLQSIKTASVLDTAARYAGGQQNLQGAAAGALLAGYLQYTSNKRPRDGGLSRMQQAALDSLESAERSDRATREAGGTPGFKQRIHKATARAAKEIADVFADHPEKGALVAVPLGVSTGLAVTRLLAKK